MLLQCLLRIITFCVKKCNFVECIHIFGLTVLQFCGTRGMNLVLSKRLLLIALLLFKITLVCLNGFMCLALLIQQIKQLGSCLQRSFSSARCGKRSSIFAKFLCNVASSARFSFCLLKLAPKVCNVCVSVCTTVDDLFCKYSKWTKLRSVIAWLLRFRNNLQRSRSENAQIDVFAKKIRKQFNPCLLKNYMKQKFNL